MKHHRGLALLAMLAVAAGCAATPATPATPSAPAVSGAPAGPATPASSSAPAVVPPPAPAATSAQTPPAVAAVTEVQVYITFYGGPDNDPPGSREIAYPNSRHAEAGGTGTFTDPLTLATDPRELSPGTVVYQPDLQKYFVMEDDCEACIDEWGISRRAHVDLWVAAAGAGVEQCEEQLTPAEPRRLEINPPHSRPVDPRPLYRAGRCWPAT